jgi:hypothetical protein
MKIMTRIGAMTIGVAATLALAIGSASAANHHTRADREAGPLIVSGGFAPAARGRRPRGPDICHPVTIKLRPMSSTLPHQDRRRR